MTIFYPDASSFQGNIALPSGNVGICEKSTQGTGYTNPYYNTVRAQAAAKGQFFFAYHFLEAGNGAAQAQHAHAVVGSGVGLMLDFEPSPTINSYPTVADAQAFVTEYRRLGGKCNLLYLPEWYWQQLHSPGLSWFAGEKMKLVASNYSVGYSDNGIGWNGYGGMSVAIWQFSSTFAFAGQRVDFNAFKGTVAEWKALVLDQSAPTHTKTWHEYLSAGELSLAGLAHKLNIGPATLLANTANHYGYFDGALGNYVKGLVEGTTKPTEMLPKGCRFWVDS